MPTYPFVTVDVFTETRFGGNPLAVFTDAQGMSDAEMQRLATEFNLSETTFVLPPADPAHTARVRIFNPAYEMPFAGHPNVGTALVLAEAGRDRDGTMVFEEIAGLVRVRIERSGGATTATIEAPEPVSAGPELPVDAIAACLSLEAGAIVTARHPPIVASVGHPFVFVEVALQPLSRATPDIAAFRKTLAAHMPDGRLAIHVYARDGDALATRMFAPLIGIVEDPATGSANAALGALLLSLGSEKERRWDVTQGVEMGRPSRLALRAWRAADGCRASVGGSCVPVLRGEAQL
ncbi:MAG: PhzF family phenazine biosynthesis protein [Sphingomonadaceae bacterium]|nr:PhzF family phenazine biosynthesis protein [Sphingomonadaceae bacterium]